MPATITNAAAVTFQAAPQAAVGQDATHYGFWSGPETNPASVFLGGKAIGAAVNPAPLNLGDIYSFAAGELDFTIPNGDGTNHMAERQANGITEGGIYVSVHSASPGSNGANELSIPRTLVAKAGWTIART